MDLKSQIIKAFNSKVFVKVGKMDDGKVPKGLLDEIEHSLKYTYRYETMTDKENGVIYIGRKV